MAAKFVAVLGMLVLSCLAQSPYVRRPVGYPVLETTSTTQSSDLSDRAGNGVTTAPTTTRRLPAEALGNRAAVEALSKLPADRQPFWLLNQQALEEQRNGARTFQQRPSIFVDSLSSVGAQQKPVDQGSQNFAQRPQNLPQIPPNFAQMPPNFGQMPHNFAQRPQNFGPLPQNFAPMPQNYAQGPQNFGPMSQNFAQMPQNFAQMQQNFPQLPQDIARPPNALFV